MTKDLNYYLQLPYTIEILPDQPNSWYVGIKELPGCMTIADSVEEAISEIQQLKEEWLQNALEDDFDIPEPRHIEDFSGNFRLRLPKGLHRKLVSKAEEENISLNTMCVYILSEAMGIRSVKTTDK
jgi:antitoxin HicB